MRITLNRKKAEMRLNIELTPEDLNKWDEKTMRFIDRDMSANALLNTLDKNFEDFRHHKSTKLNEYNVKTIRNLIMGLDVMPNPLIINYIDKYYSSAIDANTEMAEGTKRNYRKALKHLNDFLAFRNLIKVDVSLNNNELKLKILDNGIGFNINVAKEGIGLANMKRRAELFSGRFEIDSSPGNGCTILIDIPLVEINEIVLPARLLNDAGKKSESSQQNSLIK